MKAWKPTFSMIKLDKYVKANKTMNKMARDVCDSVKIPEVVEPFSQKAIRPELWQPWMAKKIMEHEVMDETMDFLEVMERRDHVQVAILRLAGEASLLKMYHAEMKIRVAGRQILDELWRIGELGD